MVEPPGFRDFVTATSRALLRTAYLLTGDEGLAEDLAQESLSRVWSRWDHVREGHPEAYTRAVLVHLHAAWWRRRWRGEVPTAALPEGSARSVATDDGVPTGGLDRELVTALRALPAGQRRIVVLRYAEDLSVEQVASLLGCSPGTVKSQASKGLAALRRALGEAATPATGGRP